MSRWIFDEKLQTGELVLTGAVTVDMAVELKALLLAAIGQSPLVQVDLDGVTQIDVAGIQLLCAAHRLAVSSGKILYVKGIGASVRLLMQGTGFAHAAVCCKNRESACLWGTMA